MTTSRGGSSLDNFANDLFKMFAPQDKDTDRIRRISRRIARRGPKHKVKSAASITGMQDDIGLLALSVLTLVKLLSEKGLISEGEFTSRLMSLDQLDGEGDGKIDPEMLLAQLGLDLSGGQLHSKAREPHPVPVARRVDSVDTGRKKAVRRRVKSGGRTAAFPAEAAPQKAAAEQAVPMDPAEVEKIASIDDLKSEIPELKTPDSSLDPSSIGEVSLDDYFK